MKLFRLLVLKEVKCLLRSRGWPVGSFVFSLVLVVLCSFAFRRVGYGQDELRDLTPGILWTIFLFCGIVVLNYSFLPEDEFDAGQGMLLTPGDPALLFFAKTLTTFVFLLLIQSVVIVLHSALFGVELSAALTGLLALTAIVAFGFASLGTLLSAIAVSVRGRELILPLMLFPLMLPQLAGAVFLSREVLASGRLPVEEFWFLLVVGFDVVSFALSFALFEFVVRE